MFWQWWIPSSFKLRGKLAKRLTLFGDSSDLDIYIFNILANYVPQYYNKYVKEVKLTNFHISFCKGIGHLLIVCVSQTHIH